MISLSSLSLIFSFFTLLSAHSHPSDMPACCPRIMPQQSTHQSAQQSHSQRQTFRNFGDCAIAYKEDHCKGSTWQNRLVISQSENETLIHDWDRAISSVQINRNCTLRVCQYPWFRRCTDLYGGLAGKDYNHLPDDFYRSISSFSCSCGSAAPPERSSETARCQTSFVLQDQPLCAVAYKDHACLGESLTIAPNAAATGWHSWAYSISSVQVYPGCSIEVCTGEDHENCRILHGRRTGKYYNSLHEKYDKAIISWNCSCARDSSRLTLDPVPYSAGRCTSIPPESRDSRSSGRAVCAIAYKDDYCNSDRGYLLLKSDSSLKTLPGEWRRVISSLQVAPGCKMTAHRAVSLCDVWYPDEHLTFAEGNYGVLPQGFDNSILSVTCNCTEPIRRLTHQSTTPIPRTTSTPTPTTVRPDDPDPNREWDMFGDPLPTRIPETEVRACAVLSTSRKPGGPFTWIDTTEVQEWGKLWASLTYVYVKVSTGCTFVHCTGVGYTGQCTFRTPPVLLVETKGMKISSYRCFC